MVDFIVPIRHDKSDELISRLESLPSYGNILQNSDESALFDDEQEPSLGLIDFIRRNSIAEQATTNSSDSVRIIQKFFWDYIIIFLSNI